MFFKELIELERKKLEEILNIPVYLSGSFKTNEYIYP
jgi:hypothetical protein